MILQLGAPSTNPCVREHIDTVKSIRGREITWDQILASNLHLMPKAFGYDPPMEAPPLPVPGVYKFS